MKLINDNSGKKRLFVEQLYVIWKECNGKERYG